MNPRAVKMHPTRLAQLIDQNATDLELARATRQRAWVETLTNRAESLRAIEARMRQPVEVEADEPVMA